MARPLPHAPPPFASFRVGSDGGHLVDLFSSTLLSHNFPRAHFSCALILQMLLPLVQPPAYSVFLRRRLSF
ncbi:hypothetical protein LMH87_004000 [Akanthomyces muscarius]|uniref:Uncharacterized protein n=1 Tax=Akanthomyces muscarius TaxID=2231603 RepID=A0A9W8Q4S4_AKAMU|nr:hypothetical protein LMH87_004000 [Akanthomyces muscarius]KAJ4145142.1 hypothetical protein LMH87_004000 [Akanthomyces muscarius]